MSDELPRVIRLMWGREEAGRGPKRLLEASDIAQAGVKIADREGLAAVSMSRVAREVGFTSMALYRYVESKDELLLLLSDHAYGRPPRLTARSWRGRLEQWAAANRDRLTRHPWVLQIPLTEPPVGPNTLAWTESGLAALAGTGLSAQQQLSSLLLVDVFVRGQTLLALNLADSGPTYSARLAQLVDPDDMPHLAAAVASGRLDDDADFASTEFTFGLARVLDGITALVEHRTRR